MISKKTNSGSTSDAGFSMLELVIVVVVIGIIAAISVGWYFSSTRKSNESSAIASLKLMCSSETSAKSMGSFANFDQLQSNGSLDESFSDGDGNAMTAGKSGYNFQLTMIDANNYIISAVPKSPSGVTATGSKRFGIDPGCVIYQDRNNTGTHYTALAQLNSGTSVAAGNDD